MTFKTIVMLCGIFCCFLTAQSQTESVFYNTEWKMGKLYRHDPTGIPNIQNPGFQINDHPRIDVRDPDAPEIPPSYQNPSSNKASQVNGTVVGIGNNFEGNHMYNSIPADNSIAISDSGLIVSIDNATIAYFKENGDSIVKFRLPHFEWYKDTSFYARPFDPRVIYDRENDRFIAVMLYLSPNFLDSRVLVSFSKPIALDSVSWNHYQINLDSIYTDAGENYYWADYPKIAVNKDELFISMAVFNHEPTSGLNSLEHSLLLQIETSPGYANALSLNCKEWKDVKNADGITDGSLNPVGDGFQSTAYGPGCYLMSNYSRNSTKFFWYELTGGINDPNAMIIPHLTSTSLFYNYPAYASQLGGNGTDRIRFEDCRIHSPLHQNGKLHFVFHKTDNGWGELVYANIDLSSNLFFSDTWGGNEQSLNSMYPSLAPFGQDSTEENFLICFQRSGPTIYPELCVINYDSGWSPTETVVKQGIGILDQKVEHVAPWDRDSLERIGDYTTIQRRYNDPNRACWLVGSYAAGPGPNHFGANDGLNAWIAEVGDSTIVGMRDNTVPGSFSMFPNPVSMESGANLNFILPGSAKHGKLLITDTQGQPVFNTKFAGSSFSKRISNLPQGLYFVTLITQNNRYEIQKLVVIR